MKDSVGYWSMKPQEQEGDYWFNGRFLVTQGVRALLSEDDIFWIYIEVQSMVQEKQGLDYLAVFERPNDDTRLFFIDNLTRTQVQSGEYNDEDHYCTLMLASEY